MRAASGRGRGVPCITHAVARASVLVGLAIVKSTLKDTALAMRR